VPRGPPRRKLEGERLSVSGGYRVGLATNGGVAREMVTAMTTGDSFAFLDQYPESVMAVSLDDVRRAVDRTIHPDRLITTVAGSLNPLGHEVVHPSTETRQRGVGGVDCGGQAMAPRRVEQHQVTAAK
jgi:threonine dehydratase